MRTIPLGTSDLSVPVIAVGCMRLHRLDADAAERFVHTAIELGATFFDHADIYGGGRSEEIFARALGGVARERVTLQSKCGIRKGMYDFSREHILTAVEGILQRLRTDYLDVLLLHRPDALMEPDEVAAAFDELEQRGLVRHFGVSNHHPRQIELLKKAVRQPLVVNQLQLSLTHAGMITSGLNANVANDEATDRDGHVLDYCRLHDITVQPWSPFQAGSSHGVFLGNDAYPELNATLEHVAARHRVSAAAVALAWLLRHPASMQPVIGTTNVERLRDACSAEGVQLSREEWYELYRAAGNALP